MHTRRPPPPQPGRSPAPDTVAATPRIRRVPDPNRPSPSPPAGARRQQKVDVTVYTTRHSVVRVEDAEQNLYASIDVVCDKVRRRTQHTWHVLCCWPPSAQPACLDAHTGAAGAVDEARSSEAPPPPSSARCSAS